MSRAPLYLLAVAGLAACEPARGTVTVTSFQDLDGPSVPTTGATVVFADRDGESRVAYIDETGHAEGEVEPGGSVWLAWWVAEQRGSNRLAAYLDVQPGAFVFGALPPSVAPSIIAHMTITGTPPAGDTVRVYSPCGREDVAFAVLALDERCQGTADILAVSIQFDAAGDWMTHYAWLPARAVVDGATIAVAAGDWRPVERVSLRLRLPAGGILGLNTYLKVSNGLVGSLRTERTGDTFSWSLPVIGDELFVAGEVKRDVSAAPQRLEVRLPLVASQDLDLATVLAPWTARDFGAGTWSTNDAGGALTADALLLDQHWDQPVANFVEVNHLRLMSAPGPLGDFAVPDLPGPLARAQPGDDFRIESVPHLARVTGGDRTQAARWADQLLRRVSQGGAIPSGEIPAASIALTLED